MNTNLKELSTDELETIQAGLGSTHIAYMVPSPNPWVDQSDLISFYQDASL
jgi:hypothetical protein